MFAGFFRYRNCILEPSGEAKYLTVSLFLCAVPGCDLISGVEAFVYKQNLCVSEQTWVAMQVIFCLSSLRAAL